MPHLLNSKDTIQGFGCNNIHRINNLVLVKIKKKNHGSTKTGQITSKIEVVDPDIAEDRRAMAQLIRSEGELSNAVEAYQSTHSVPDSRKRKSHTSSKNKKAQVKSVRTKINRVKDIFD